MIGGKTMKKLLGFFMVAMLFVTMLSVPIAATENEADDPTDTTVPDLPTATVTPLESPDDPELSFALNFLADEPDPEQLAYYGDWYADFVLTLNKTTTFNADDENADGYLAGQYDFYSSNWVAVPFDDVTMQAGQSLKIMEYAAELMDMPGLRFTYELVYTLVKDFDCGVYFNDSFLNENPDLVVTLALRMYNPDDETENYIIGDEYIFRAIDLFAASVTGTDASGEVKTNHYADLSTALSAAKDGDTVTLLKSITADTSSDFTIDANITLEGKNCIITASESCAQLLNVSEGKTVTIQNLTLDGKDIAEIGLNANNATVNLENVTIKNNVQYGIAANGSTITANGLTTAGNGQGGILADAAANHTALTLSNSNCDEALAVKALHSNPAYNVNVEIKSGTYKGVSAAEGTSFIISGGTFTSDSDFTKADGNTLIIKGGNFNLEPDQNDIAEGYVLLKVGDVYNVHKHELKKVAEVAATYTAPGVITHNHCTVCGQNFHIETGKLLTDSELVIPQLVAPQVVQLPKTAEITALTESSIALTYAPDTAVLGEITVTSSNTDVVSILKVSSTYEIQFRGLKPGTATITVATASGHTAACEVTVKSLPSTQPDSEAHTHTLTKVAAKAPSYTTEGNIEYYACSGCDQKFSDAAGTQMLTSVILPQLIAIVDDIAEVSEGAVEAALEAADSLTDVKLDLTSDTLVGEETNSVSKIQLPVSAIEKVGEAMTSLTLISTEATITFDSQALTTIAEQAEGSTVTIVVEEIAAETLNTTQQASIKDQNVAAVISAEIICSSTNTHLAAESAGGFGGGTVTIMIPFTPQAGYELSDYVIMYVSDDGDLETIKTEYQGNYLLAYLEHLSEYVIVNTKQATIQSSNPATGDYGYTAPVVLAVFCLAAISGLVIGKKKFIR